MAQNEVARPDRVAKLKRDLAELRARMGRIDHETFNAKRELAELEGDLTALLGGAS